MILAVIRLTTMNFVALDFETANESRDSACAIGVTQVRDGMACEPVYHLIRPADLRFSHWNTRVHGITADDVADAPTMGELWPVLSHLIENQLVVAHNASFDMSVLRHSLHTASICVPRLSYLCSLNLARQAWPQLASHSLGFLAEIHGLALDHHHAGSDSRVAAELLLLAAQTNRINCPRALSESFNVSIGEIYSDDDWIPSSAPGLRRDIEAIEVTLPDGYDVSDHPFHNMNIVFTGTLTMFRRDEAHRVVELFGGRPKTSVSKKTNFLVAGVQDLRQLAAGTNESSKLRKARELRDKGIDVRIITDTDFTELVFSPTNTVQEAETYAKRD